ncbi:hypothetical protein [Halopenitus persicus]|uniref:Uncharacterized protein n=1 Tax=Halopenitus persicus TaxID=1048396 RepID=A0A1H3ND24_9EURY|nr:hypothetical protein [Halopenitus persicus]SDY86355.1 hypothetical protein SAMN05216564_11241 [Halopenitus persicus]
MTGDSDSYSHPARKVDLEELKQVAVEKHRKVPAVTRRMVAPEFPEVDPATIGQNLDDLVDADEIRRFNDGDVKLWWYPRENEEGGSVSYNELFDDSIDFDEIEPEMVPRDLAKEIAYEKLPYYDPGSLWRDIARATQSGIMFSLGLIIAAFGGAISGSFGLTEETYLLVLQLGVVGALFTTGIYVAAAVLDILASREHISRDPFPQVRQFFR